MPALDAVVELPSGRYVLGEPGEERTVALERVLIGRYPVVNAHLREFLPHVAKLADPQLADHPATDVTRAAAEAFCGWASERLGRRVRLPGGGIDVEAEKAELGV